MIANEVAIMPTPELIEQWMTEEYGYSTAVDFEGMKLSIAKHAAKWGADQELEACCKCLDKDNPGGYWSGRLRAGRRPKPPSLKEQALAMLDDTEVDAIHYDTIRRALESIPEDQ
jgi:hypothetical protein